VGDPAMLVDFYELTMAAAMLREGRAWAPATFSLFVRSLPANRGFLVAAGLEDALGFLESLHFDEEDLDWLANEARLPDALLEQLRGVRFAGSVRAVPEGTIVFAGEPLIEVTGPFLVAQLAETMLLNELTTQTNFASKAARYRHAARGSPVVDFGSRRAQGRDAAMRVARAAALCGLAGTSNVEAARRYRLAASGTMGHSFVQAHPDERSAFRSFAAQMGRDAVFIVDTYDLEEGLRAAIEVALEAKQRGETPRGVRIDSGDLAAGARLARRLLDEAGLGEMAVLVSGGLDEMAIERLVVEQRAPIDAFGVGSNLAVSADAPVLESVYKLVEFDGRPVLKLSPGKETWPGAKQVWRLPDWAGDVVSLAAEAGPTGAQPLLVEVMRDGERTEVGKVDLAEAASVFERQWRSLPLALRDLKRPARYPVRPSSGIEQLIEAVRRTQL
jgi:nicotinate phosphoribosyltransferase